MKKILVVDDDSFIITLINAALAGGSYRIYNAANVEDAIKLVNKERFDCLITDIIMAPGEDGTHLMQYVRDKQPDVPVLAITGGIENGVKDYVHLADMFSDHTLAKPFGKNELHQALEKLFA